MSTFENKLSAYLDGELPAAEAREIETALNADPDLQAELERLMETDALVKEAYEAELNDPVPFALASAIQSAPERTPKTAVRANSRWMGAAAAVLTLAIGGAAGYMLGQTQGVQVASAPGWLEDIADYHRVYSGQERHLVEVPAAELEHIQTWLTASIGSEVRVPDLSDQGLTFEGARLLVAAGKPVSQLMYTDAAGQVVALCQIASQTPREGFGEQTLQAFKMVSWGGNGANFVIVGDEGRDDLAELAQIAASRV